MKYESPLIKEFICPLEYGLDRFGRKWKSKILCILSAHSMIRYNMLKKELGNITDPVLAAMLKELVADHLILRTQYNEVPPRVEYGLSEKGKSVLPILQNICRWSLAESKEELKNKICRCRACPHL